MSFAPSKLHPERSQSLENCQSELQNTRMFETVENYLEMNNDPEFLCQTYEVICPDAFRTENCLRLLRDFESVLYR